MADAAVRDKRTDGRDTRAPKLHTPGHVIGLILVLVAEGQGLACCEIGKDRLQKVGRNVVAAQDHRRIEGIDLQDAEVGAPTGVLNRLVRICRGDGVVSVPRAWISGYRFHLRQ